MKNYAKALMQFIIFMCVIVPYFTSISFCEESTANMAKFVLDKMAESRDKVENYKCTYEVKNFHTDKGRKARYETYLKIGHQELADRVLEEVYSFRTDSLALDNQGRGRVDILEKEIDNQGNLKEKDIRRNIITWDGKNAINYIEDSETPNATIGVTEAYLPVTDSYNQPWRSFGGNLYDFFKEAFEANKIIDVQRQDRIYKVEFAHQEDMRIIGLIDPDQGFSVVSQEVYYQDTSNTTYKAEFEEVKPGIWFPKSGVTTVFSQGDVIEEKTMKVTKIEINTQNFYNGLYHVDFREGTKVYDKKNGLLYVVADSMSQQVINSDSISSRMDDISKKEIEQNPSINSIVFIPKASDALKETKAFILNLPDNQLLNSKAKPDSEESDTFLKELGKGDIAWDGKIIAVREAALFTIKQNANKPLKYTEGNWSISYELPEKVELPYSMLVLTKEKKNYLVKISKIEPEGITINYEELSIDQMSIYKD